MADGVGERLAALEAAFKEFKEGLGRRIDDLQKAIAAQVEAVSAKVTKVNGDVEKILWRVVPAAIGAFVLVWGTIGLAYKEMYGLERKMGQFATKQELPLTTENLNKVLGPVTAALQELTNVVNSGHGGSTPPGTLNILVFDDRQLLLIRNTLPKATTDIVPEADKLSLGEFIKDPRLLSALSPVPDSTLKDVPQLQATKFLVGTNNIVIARTANSQVVAIIARS